MAVVPPTVRLQTAPNRGNFHAYVKKRTGPSWAGFFLESIRLPSHRVEVCVTRKFFLLPLTTLAVGVATLLTYLPTRHFDFVNWDDYEYVIDNDLIRSFDLNLFTGAFSTGRPWFPLTWISLAWDNQFWGLDPSGYHLTNIILHSVNACLATYVFYRLTILVMQRWRIHGGDSIACNKNMALMSSLVAGLLYALHPQRVESVAWVTERKDVLGGLFASLALLAYLRYAECSGEGCRQRRWYALTALFLLLSFCSKGTFVTIPAVFLILDWYPLRRANTFHAWLSVVKEKIPYFCMSAVVSLMTMLSFSSSFPSIGKISVATRFLVAIRAAVKYLAMQLWPLNLSPYYVYPRHVTLADPDFLLPVIVFIAITLAAILSVRRTRAILAAWLFFLVTLFPMLGLIQSGWQEMADRFTYFPSMGSTLFFCAANGYVWQLILRPKQYRPLMCLLGGLIAIAVVAVSVLVTRNLLPAWRNSETLWSRAIEVDPNYNGKAYYYRATYYMGRDENEKALADITRSLEIGKAKKFSGIGDLYFLRAEIYQNLAENGLAIDDYTTALSATPRGRWGLIYARRGAAWGRSGREDLARDDLQEAEALGIYPFRGL